MPELSAGHAAYLADCRNAPFYHDGTPRKSWSQLSDAERWSWERNPTPRKPLTIEARFGALQ